LVDEDGRALAEIAYRRKDKQSVDLLRPNTDPTVLAALDAWVADRSGVLGVVGFSSEEEEEVRRGRHLPAGALVRGTVLGSAAERDGLQRGDVITKVGETDVNGLVELQALLRSWKAGDRVSVAVIRDGQELRMSIELGSPSGW
jgi:S1-C subfamily serine protease